MSAILLGTLKRGDTFGYIATIQNTSDEVLSGVAEKLKSQVRDKVGNLVAELSVSETAQPGTYVFQYLGNTQDWKIGDYEVDFQYKDGSVVVSSPTFILRIIKDVTRDE